MTIFGKTKLGRAAYCVVLLFIVGFDFVKSPVEQFIMAQHDLAARELGTQRRAPPATTAPPPSATQRTNEHVAPTRMPLMLPGQEEVIRRIASNGHKPTAEDMEDLRNATIKGAAQVMIRSNTSEAASRRAFFELLYLIAGIVMMAVTIVGLLYAVSSRLRDIGWTQALLWALLAPVFVPKFLGLPLPPLAIQGVSVFFYGALLVLALIPSAGSRPHEPAPVAQPQATIKRRSGQFGKLGTH